MIIDRAARAEGSSRTEFIRAAATRRAEEVLLERSHPRLGRDEFRAFVSTLKAPEEPVSQMLAKADRVPPWKDSSDDPGAT